MSNKIKKKFEELLQFVVNQEKYKEQFLKSITNGLFDFSIILIWKTLILFDYEKMYEVAYQIGESTFLDKWKNKFGRTPRNYKKQNTYWPNEEKEGDNKVIQFLGVIYRIDSNFIKQLHSLKPKRDTAAHVSDLCFNEEDVDNYLFEILRVVKELQKCYTNDYLKTFIIDDFEKLRKMELSKQDLQDLICILINNLVNASTFKTAKEYKKRILHLEFYLTGAQIIRILDEVFNNPCGINQVLESTGISNFFKQLYNLGKVGKDYWKNFAIKILEYYKEEHGDETESFKFYNWLFDDLGLFYNQKEDDEIPF